MLYPQAGQPVLDRYTLPRYDAPNDLARVKGMKNGAIATLPGARGGILRYVAALLAGRNLYQDDFGTLDGWTLDTTSGTAVATDGQVIPTISFGTTDGNFYGPGLLKDLGQTVANLAAGVEIEWLNNSVTHQARAGLVFLDASMNTVAAMMLADLSTTLCQTIGVWYGSGWVETGFGSAIGSSTFSSVNPNSGKRWIGIQKSGTNFIFQTLTDSVSVSIPGAADVRYIKLVQQSRRASGINYPIISKCYLDSFFALVDQTNAASSALAIAQCAPAGVSTISSAFDSITTTSFLSYLADVLNYGGGAWIGQARPEAARYPRPAYVTIQNATSGATSNNFPTDMAYLEADDLAGPWDTVGTYANLSRTLGAINLLAIPVGLPGRRYWRVQPTAGIGIGAGWAVGELRAYYGAANPNPARQVPAYFADGAWNMDTPAQGFNALPSYLGW